MFRGNWSDADRLVLGSLTAIAVVGLGLIFLLEWQNQPEAEQPHYPPAYETPVGAPTNSQWWSGEHPASYQSICERPQSATDADLCQQWRNAESAARVVELGRQQILLAWASLIGLLTTIWISISTYRLTIRTSKAELRSYIQVKIGQMQVSNGRIYAFGRAENVGQTPAYKVSTYAEVFTCDKPPSADDHAEIARYCEFVKERGIRTSLTVGSGHDVGIEKEVTREGGFIDAFGGDVATAMAGGKKTIAYVGVVTYEDIFGQPHLTHFCHTFALRNGVWVGAYDHQGNHAD